MIFSVVFLEGWCGVGIVESVCWWKLVFEGWIFLRGGGGEDWCFEVECGY